MACVGAEELRRLHDSDTRLVEVRQRLGDENWWRREVSVENDEDLTAGAFEGIPQIAGLLHPAAILADLVRESEIASQVPSVRVGPVIKHQGNRVTGIGTQQVTHICPGVMQQLQWLSAGRQEDVHIRVTSGSPGMHLGTVRSQVKVPAGKVW